MRRPSEIQFDIDTITHTMTKLVIQQNDIDNELSRWDRRLAFLHKELAEAVNVSKL